MSNAITRTEIYEQFGDLKLQFEFYSGNQFVFNGKDSFDNEVTMFVHKNHIYFTSEHSIVFIADFFDLSGKFVNFLIIDKNLNIIYQG
jgi:hypothetical protein